MLETGVHCSRVDLVRPGELAYSAESLKRRVVDNVPFPVVDRDEPVNWTAKFVGTVRIPHGQPSGEGFVCNLTACLFTCPDESARKFVGLPSQSLQPYRIILP